MGSWHQVRLKGKEQVIPELCPNCLGPSTHRFRYGYKGWKGMLTRTTYYQSFYYCEPCMNQADSALGLNNWSIFGFILGLIAFVSVLIATSEAWRDPQTRKVPDHLMTLGLILGASAAALALFGIRGLAKLIKQKKYPKTEAQAVWGAAAFFVGSGFMDMQNLAVYRAVRREWMAELVRLNPQQVDDATYQSWVGQARPAAAPEGRPFGG